MTERNEERQENGGVSRRTMLKTLGIGGLAVASFSTLFAGADSALAAPVRPFQDAKDDVQTILNLAATAEALATTAYYATIASAGFSLSDEHVLYFKLAMDAEQYHYDFLTSAGGKPLTQEFYVPANFLTDKATNLQTLIAAETAFIGAYLAATRRFGELGQGRLAATTAQHAASETEHLALARDIAGFVPNPNGLPAPIYYNVSDAVPTLTPFLTGGEGFIGPVAHPNADAVKALLNGVSALRVPTFTMVF